MKKLSAKNKNVILIYLGIYLATCFVRWEIYNPLEFLKTLPSLSNEDRGYLLLCYLSCIFLIHLAAKVIEVLQGFEKQVDDGK